MRKSWWFALAVGVQFLLLLGMAADQALVVARGRPVRVAVKPVDPMSLFQGEYARLGYEFSTLDQKALEELGEGGSTFRKGEKVRVVLYPDAAETWRPIAFSRDLAGGDEGRVAIRAEVSSFSTWSGRDWDAEKNKQTGPVRRHATLVLHTGLESFFVPQGEAEKLERTVREGEVTAELAVLPSGRAAVRKLLVKDREVSF
jgi:uncharacterized membrane-anchored protein